MLTLRQSPFHLLRSDLLESDLFQSLERQLSSAQPPARQPAADVQEGPEAYTITLELPGVDKASIDVKASDRSLVVSAERQRATDAPTTLLREIHVGSWSRSFRFPGGINREALSAHYRDGLLTVTAPKAQTLTSVQVQVED